MDGMNYFGTEIRTPRSEDAPTRTVARSMVLTLVLAVVVVGVLIGLRLAGVEPLIADQIAFAPIGS